MTEIFEQFLFLATLLHLLLPHLLVVRRLLNRPFNGDFKLFGVPFDLGVFTFGVLAPL